MFAYKKKWKITTIIQSFDMVSVLISRLSDIQKKKERKEKKLE